MLAGSCSNYFAGSSSSSAKGSVTIILANQSSKTIVPGDGDYSASAKAYKVTIANGSNTYTSSSVSSGLCTVGGIAAGTSYSATVQAFSDSSATTQIAQGAVANLTISSGATTSASVTLSFNQTSANTGGFSLPVEWPVSTALPYVYATLDGTAISTPAVTTGTSNYSATLVASALAGGSHTLDIYFSSSATYNTNGQVFVESVNIWDGVSDTMWADSSGNLHASLALASSQFMSNDATLSSLSPSGSLGLAASFFPTTLVYNYATAPSGAFTVTAVCNISGASLSCYYNEVSTNWATVSGGAYTTAALTASGSDKVQIIVTAPDHKTKTSYVLTTATQVNGSNLSSLLSTTNSAALAGNYILNSDVTISSVSGLLGAYGYPFTGSFDGNGHTVTFNMGTIAKAYFGLFAENGGLVKNLHVAISYQDNSGNDIQGGVAGVNDYYGTIYHCYATGSITRPGDTGNFIGGLVGDNFGLIQECYSTVSITGANTAVGSLVGNSMNGAIKDCYATGSVSGRIVVGGLSGEWNDVTRTYGYGYCFIPSDTYGTVQISNCYSTGSVSDTSSTYTDAFFAYGYTTSSQNPPTWSNCFYDSDTAGCSSTSVNPLATSEMKDPSNLSAWSISTTLGASTVWGIDTTGTINNGYPYLQYFGANTVTP